MRRTYLPAILFVTLLLPLSAGAREITLLDPYLSAGHALTTANAATGVSLDEGLAALWANPAGIVVDHHELYGEGSIRGAFSTQSQVSPDPWRASVGMIGYLYSFRGSALALAYVPRNAYRATATYSGAEVVDRAKFNEITATYAHQLTGNLTAGLSFGAIFGSAHEGALTSEAEKDTVYKPTVWFARAGIRYRQGVLRWGIAVETPGIGKYTVERPVNVGYKRDKTHLEYRGAPAVRAGIGWDLKFAALEVDALYANAGMIRVDGEKIRAGDGKTDHVSPLVSSGLALHLQLDDRIRVRSGVRVRFEDPVELTFTQLGFGGSYVIDGELTAYGSAGLLIPNGSEAETGVLGDLRTFVLRAGVVYQGLME